MIAPENVTDPHSRHVLHAVGDRHDVLDEVRRVTDDRGRRYGPVDRHWQRTVGALNSLLAHKLREPLDPSDWGIIMAVDKLAREMETSIVDNTLDAIGYLFKRSQLVPPLGEVVEGGGGDGEGEDGRTDSDS